MLLVPSSQELSEEYNVLCYSTQMLDNLLNLFYQKYLKAISKISIIFPSYSKTILKCQGWVIYYGKKLLYHCKSI